MTNEDQASIKLIMKNKEKTNDAPKLQSGQRPYEFSDSVMWAAWLYFVDEMTQSEIANRIGVSRVTVIKMLTEAKSRGLVTVQISSKVAAHTLTSRQIASTYYLNSVTIIPDMDNEPLVPRLGKAGAFALSDMLQEDDIVGVAWGRTVLAVAEAINLVKPIERLTVVQVSASPNGLSSDFSPELCSLLLASHLNARSVNLLAPALVTSAKLKELLMAEPSIKKQFEVIKSANKLVFGVGDVGKKSTLRNSELHDPNVVDALIKKGAVGVIIGRFIDKNGNEVRRKADDRMIGVSLDELKAIPYRLIVAGGKEKIESIRAALAGGFATDLVIDQSTAERLIE